jgi:hypothetical protein
MTAPRSGHTQNAITLKHLVFKQQGRGVRKMEGRALEGSIEESPVGWLSTPLARAR